MTADMLLSTVLCMLCCCWSRVDRHKLMVLVGSWFPVNVYIFSLFFFYLCNSPNNVVYSIFNIKTNRKRNWVWSKKKKWGKNSWKKMNSIFNVVLSIMYTICKISVVEWLNLLQFMEFVAKFLITVFKHCIVIKVDIF